MNREAVIAELRATIRRLDVARQQLEDQRALYRAEIAELKSRICAKAATCANATCGCRETESA